MLRRLTITALALVAVLLVASCAMTAATSSNAPVPAPSVEAPAFPVTVTDAGGQAITLQAPARKIVSHSPGVTEILFAIGAGGQIAAVDEFSNYPEAAKPLQRVRYSNPSAEVEVGLAPDLVILSANQRAHVDTFRRLGLTVYYNHEPESIDAVLANVRLMGRLTGHVEEAEALASKMRARIDAVTARLSDVQQGPKVFYEISDSLYTAGPGSFVGGMLAALKVRNIAQGTTTQFPQLSSEAVIAAAPDAILLADAKFGGSPEKVRARPGWSAIPAVAHDRLHVVEADLVNRPGPRIVEGIELMARLLYPERFP